MEKDHTNIKWVEKVRSRSDVQVWRLHRSPSYIGLDIHKDTIAASVTDGTLSSEPQYIGRGFQRIKVYA